MKPAFALLFACLFSAQFAHAQVLESSVDFTIAPGTITDGTLQYALEWITPSEFRKKEFILMDIPKVNALHPSSNHMVVSKLAFVAKKSFDSLSYQKMNNSTYISQMLNSVEISQKAAPDLWSVTNKVVAYSIPFRVTFDFNFKEVKRENLNSALVQYLTDEASGFKTDKRERILLLDMTNFTELMYRNYSVVYMKEISPTETFIVSGVVAGFDLNKANRYFQYPPFSTAKGTVISNVKTQILHMVKKIQN